MKKLLFAISILCIASCKKTYTCECYTTFKYHSVGSGVITQVIPGNNEPYGQKMTEKQARAACAHEAKAVETDFTDHITSNGTYTLTYGSPTTICYIK